MIFTELRFVLFFALAFAVHWGLRGSAARKAWLLFCSWGFYCAWDWRFLGLILVSTAVDLVAGGRIAASGDERVRRGWLLVSLTVNLGLLGFFKYFGWFVHSAYELFSWLGLPGSEPTLAIVLPVGISFYTFQTLSYTIDIYRGRLAPARSSLDLALFVAFFPQLVAGPIVRAAEFLPQLERPVRFARVDARACLVLFLVGYFKKEVVSDTVAELVVDRFFENPLAFDTISALTAVLFELVVLYCDFSGYSDMAIATAGLLGYNLVVNFRFPWFAPNTADFWRRWHISLSTWMRDYVFHPLGGTRGTQTAYVRNVMLTMIAIGLWHGAAWKFVAFGAIHGLGIVTYRGWSRSPFARALPSNALTLVLATTVTVGFHALTMPFFRAADLTAAAGVVRSLATWSAPGRESLGGLWLVILAGLTLVHWIAFRNAGSRWWNGLPRWAFAVAFGTACAAILACSAPLSAPFVYFQF